MGRARWDGFLFRFYIFVPFVATLSYSRLILSFPHTFVSSRVIIHASSPPSNAKAPLLQSTSWHHLILTCPESLPNTHPRQLPTPSSSLNRRSSPCPQVNQCTHHPTERDAEENSTSRYHQTSNVNARSSSSLHAKIPLLSSIQADLMLRGWMSDIQRRELRLHALHHVRVRCRIDLGRGRSRTGIALWMLAANTFRRSRISCCFAFFRVGVRDGRIDFAAPVAGVLYGFGDVV
jgi:hypothetical protein